MMQTTDFRLRTSKYGERGLTMIELLVVVAIVGVLVVAMIWAFRAQPERARDAKRKAELRTYVTAFEDYFNDKGRYPPEGSLDDCGGSGLQPYIASIKCDPGPGNSPYDYITDDIGTWFGICTSLENDSDPDIAKVGCSEGCGTGGESNYCAVVGTSISAVGGSFPESSGGVGMGENVGDWACFSGVCNRYDSNIYSCTYTWSTSSACGVYCQEGSTQYECD